MDAWVVEGSEDGASWAEIHRQPNRDVYVGLDTASFAIETQKGREWRFIRLTTTHARHNRRTFGYNHPVGVYLFAVEFFGTLFE
jgi:hypothetical protein